MTATDANRLRHLVSISEYAACNVLYGDTDFMLVATTPTGPVVQERKSNLDIAAGSIRVQSFAKNARKRQARRAGNECER